MRLGFSVKAPVFWVLTSVEVRMVTSLMCFENNSVTVYLVELGIQEFLGNCLYRNPYTDLSIL